MTSCILLSAVSKICESHTFHWIISILSITSYQLHDLFSHVRLMQTQRGPCKPLSLGQRVGQLSTWLPRTRSIFEPESQGEDKPQTQPQSPSKKTWTCCTLLSQCSSNRWAKDNARFWFPRPKTPRKLTVSLSVRTKTSPRYYNGEKYTDGLTVPPRGQGHYCQPVTTYKSLDYHNLFNKLNDTRFLIGTVL